jgi:hypothetical protein
LRISTPQEAVKAGQAWRRSSLSQPGKALKVDGVISGAGGCSTGGCGCGTGTITGGGILTGGRTGCGGATGVVVHAARASATIPRERGKLRRAKDIRTDMWMLMMEAAVAFFLLVFIVWWTMYADKRPDHQERALRAPDKPVDKQIDKQADDTGAPPELPRE